MMNRKSVTRRRVLQGSLYGSTVVLGLPLLDCFLDENGTAHAAEYGGGELPTIFGTWSWALGLTPGRWEPTGIGSDFTFGPQLQLLEPVKDRLNLFTGLQVLLDGKTVSPHETTGGAIMTGEARSAADGFGVSLDAVIANRLDVRTRFPSITVACDGQRMSSWSSRNSSALDPAEVSPAALYQTIFGESFVDPNAAEFKPDPVLMARRSVLSAVSEDRQRLLRSVGASDRERLDSLFTSLRDLEQRLALELEEPPPLAACRVPQPPEGEKLGLMVEDMERVHKLFAELLAYALACGQTRIFNVTFSKGVTDMRMAGDSTGYHLYTHEEPVDREVGYQRTCSWFVERSMGAFLHMIKSLDAYREGGQTLLDRTLMLAFTDHGDARLHSLKDFMMFTVGGANGRLKVGQHVHAPGETCGRVALTCQRALDIPVKSWGTGSNNTSSPFSELLT